MAHIWDLTWKFWVHSDHHGCVAEVCGPAAPDEGGLHVRERAPPAAHQPQDPHARRHPGQPQVRTPASPSECRLPSWHVIISCTPQKQTKMVGDACRQHGCDDPGVLWHRKLPKLDPDVVARIRNMWYALTYTPILHGVTMSRYHHELFSDGKRTDWVHLVCRWNPCNHNSPRAPFLP